MSSAISEFLFKQNLYFKTILFNKSSSSKYRLKITSRAGNINIFSVHPHDMSIQILYFSTNISIKVILYICKMSI